MKTDTPDGFAAAPCVHGGRRQQVHRPHDDADGKDVFARLLSSKSKSEGGRAARNEPATDAKSAAGGGDMASSTLQLASLIAQAPVPTLAKHDDVRNVRPSRDAKGGVPQETAVAHKSAQRDEPTHDVEPARQAHCALPLDIMASDRHDDDLGNRNYQPAKPSAAASSAASPPVLEHAGDDKPVKPAVTGISLETHLTPTSLTLPLMTKLTAGRDVPADAKAAATPLVQLPAEQVAQKPLQILKVQFDHEATGPLSATLKLRHNVIAVQFEAKDETVAVSLRDDAAKLALDLKSSGYAIDGVTVQATRCEAARGDTNPNPSRQQMDSGGQAGLQDSGQPSTSQSAGDDETRRPARRRQDQRNKSHEENRRVSRTRAGGVYL